MAHGRRLLRGWLDRSHTQQQHLAREIGISKAYLSQVLNGERRPKLETLVRLEAVTGVPVVSWTDTGVSETDEQASDERIAGVLKGQSDAAGS